MTFASARHFVVTILCIILTKFAITKKQSSLDERAAGPSNQSNEADDAFLGRAAFVNSKIVKDWLAARRQAAGRCGCRSQRTKRAPWPEAGEARKERKEGRNNEAKGPNRGTPRRFPSEVE